MVATTLRDVAQLARVSVKTVSNVVNDHPHVSEDVRRRVGEAVRQLGYRPNLAARALRAGRTGKAPAADIMGTVTFGDLFTPVPLRWGLRGDPHLWEALRLRFAAQPLPADQWTLAEAVGSAFRELTGVPLAADAGHVPMPAYRIGRGISDGVVDGGWWHDTGLTLLLDRWNVASAGRAR